MATALLYNSADLQALLAALNAALPALSGGDRTAIQRLRDAVQSWQSLPSAPAERRQNDPDTRLLVLTRADQSRQATVDLLDRVHARGIPGTAFLGAIVKDMRTSAVDPWP